MYVAITKADSKTIKQTIRDIPKMSPKKRPVSNDINDRLLIIDELSYFRLNGWTVCLRRGMVAKFGKVKENFYQN